MPSSCAPSCPVLVPRPPQGKTRFGTPVKVTDLGETQIPPALFESYLDGLSATFGPGMYHLLERNCNNFSNEASEFLVGRGIPSDIVSMPQDLLNSYGRRTLCNRL